MTPIMTKACLAMLLCAATTASSASERLVLRRHVEGALAAIGEAAAPELIALLDSGVGEQRRSAARLLSLLENGDAAAIEALTRALESNDAVVRRFAAMGLRRRADFAGAAAPALVRQARQETDRDARRHAILALGSIGQGGEETASALLATLQSDDVTIREASVKAFKQFIAPSEAVLSALAARLADRGEEATVRMRTIEALVRYGNADISRITQAQDSLPPALRMHFVQELGLVDTASPLAESALVAALDDPDPLVRRHATIALGAISMRSPQGDQALAEMLRDDRNDVRSTASRALQRLKDASQTHVLKLLADTNDPEVTLAALRALHHDRVPAPEAARIASYLNSQHALVRQAATEVLGYVAETSDLAFRVLRDAAAHDQLVSPDAISVLSRLRSRRVDAEEALRRQLVLGEGWRGGHVLEAFAAAGAPLTDATKQTVLQLLDDSMPLVSERAARLTVSAVAGWPEGAKASLEHANAAVRHAAMDSLADPALAELVEPRVLLEYLRGPNARYAAMAARALGINKLVAKRLVAKDLGATNSRGKGADAKNADAKNAGAKNADAKSSGMANSGVAAEPQRDTFAVLHHAFQSADPAVAEASLRALVDLGLLKQDDLLSLIETSPRAETVMRVLAKLDIDGARTIDVLIPKLLAADNLPTRLAASELLGRLGEPAVARVRPLLWQDDPIVLELALNVVRLAGPRAAEAVPDLIALLDP